MPVINPNKHTLGIHLVRMIGKLLNEHLHDLEPADRASFASMILSQALATEIVIGLHREGSPINEEVVAALLRALDWDGAAKLAKMAMDHHKPEQPEPEPSPLHTLQIRDSAWNGALPGSDAAKARGCTCKTITPVLHDHWTFELGDKCPVHYAMIREAQSKSKKKGKPYGNA